MKKTLKFLLAIMLIVGMLVVLTACDEKKDETKVEKTEAKDSIDWSTLNDEEKIEHAVHQELKKAYGDKLSAAKIYVDKIYTKEEIEGSEVLKGLDIKDKEFAFEVSIYIEPAEGADIMLFTATDGVYDEETGWVSEIYRLGILRYNEKDKTYTIDHYGTGW